MGTHLLEDSFELRSFDIDEETDEDDFNKTIIWESSNEIYDRDSKRTVKFEYREERFLNILIHVVYFMWNLARSKLF